VAALVEWTYTALSDLTETAEFIQRSSPSLARSIVCEARAAGRSLRRFATRGRPVPESSTPDIREIFVRDYRLIYQVTSRTVYILTFVHGGRDLAAIWERSGGPPRVGT
jgi:addiction module RelE/StbE family toxin